MTMINNIDLIAPLLIFDSSDTFYHLQIIKRKKEHRELGSNSYIVKTYYITSIEYLNDKMFEIIGLCDMHNARAYINLNKRSFEKLAFHTLKKVTDCIMNNDYKSVRKAYESVCGTYSNEENKKWVLDFDTDDRSFLLTLDRELQELNPNGIKVLSLIPTKNGYHLITKPFDVSKFDTLFGNWSVIQKPAIHKNNPTVLYVP